MKYLMALFIIGVINIQAQSTTSQSPSANGPLPFNFNPSSKNAPYFCGARLRGKADQINIDLAQNALQLSGNISIQNDIISLYADNITLVESKDGFSLYSNSTQNKQMHVFIYHTPLILPSCQKGLKIISSDSVEYEIKTNIFEWQNNNQANSLVLKGDSIVQNYSLDLIFWGQSINFKLSNKNEVDSIVISDKFRVAKDSQAILADKALIDILNKKIIAIGSVKLQIKNYALLKADRVEIDLGDKKRLIANNVETNLDLFVP